MFSLSCFSIFEEARNVRDTDTHSYSCIK